MDKVETHISEEKRFILRYDAHAALEKLRKYYVGLDDDIFFISNILDPNLKLEFYRQENWHSQYVGNVGNHSDRDRV